MIIQWFTRSSDVKRGEVIRVNSEQLSPSLRAPKLLGSDLFSEDQRPESKCWHGKEKTTEVWTSTELMPIPTLR